VRFVAGRLQAGVPLSASPAGGFVRNLRSGELADQVLTVSASSARRRPEITNIVFMGMGEPLDNLDELLRRSPSSPMIGPWASRPVG